jgi:hypothetical protein
MMADQERLEEIRARHQGVGTDDSPVCDGCQDLYEEPSAWPCDTALWIAEADRLAERVKAVIEAYEGKVQDFAKETLRVDALILATHYDGGEHMVGEAGIGWDAAMKRVRAALAALPAHQEEGG